MTTDGAASGPATVGAVVNPVSGDGDGRALFEALASRFPGATVRQEVTRGPEDVPRATRALADDVDLLVSVGGDGTLREVASALYEWRLADPPSDGPAAVEAGSATPADADTERPAAGIATPQRDAPPLFVVPAGRGNSVYRHCYGETDWRTVAERLAGGVRRHPLELTALETEPPTSVRYSVLGVTVGLFRHALDAAERLRRLPGPLAYLLGTGAATLFADPVPVRLGSGEQQLFAGEARLVAVGGGRFRGGTTPLLPESRPGDGCLHALVLEPVGWRGALSLTRLAGEGRHVEHPAVHYFTGESFDVRAGAGTGFGSTGGEGSAATTVRGNLPAEVDGTPLPDLTDVHCEVRPDALSLAYPPAMAGR
jgi:diacylglycerol kinase family enzyme